jgi:hypothetical protein
MELVIIWCLFGIGAAVVAGNRGESGCLWFGLGVLLGPIGFALAFTLGSKCPKCASKISSSAKVCPHCGYTEEQPAAPHGTRPCPVCAEKIQEAAKKCRFCGELFDATPSEP